MVVSLVGGTFLRVFGVFLEQNLFVFYLPIPKLCRGVVKRTIIVWLAQQTLKRYQDCCDTVGCRPLLFEDVEADVAVLVDVGVEAWCDKFDQRCVVWVFVREFHGQRVFEPCINGSFRTYGIKNTMFLKSKPCPAATQFFACAASLIAKTANLPTILQVHSKRLSPLGNALTSSFPPTTKNTHGSITVWFSFDSSVPAVAMQQSTTSTPFRHEPIMSCASSCLSRFRTFLPCFFEVLAIFGLVAPSIVMPFTSAMVYVLNYKSCWCEREQDMDGRFLRKFNCCSFRKKREKRNEERILLRS